MLKGKGVIVHGFLGFPELKGCVELRQRIWGSASTNFATGMTFPVAVKHGQVLGVLKAERLVGFTPSFSLLVKARAHFRSNIVAVPPEHQKRVKRQLLKLAQRNQARTRGNSHIERTFDVRAQERARRTDHKSLSSSRALPQASLANQRRVNCISARVSAGWVGKGQAAVGFELTGPRRQGAL
jgi:hypothetical protein